MKHKRILTSIAMAALVLVSVCAVGVSTLSVSAAQGSSATVQAPGVVGAPVGAGAPAAYAVDSTHLFLFIRGADNLLYVKPGALQMDGTWKWGPSTLLGAVMTSAPAATAVAPTTPTSGVIDVFCRGSDGVIWNVLYSISTNNLIDAKSIGGKVNANQAPSACSWGSGHVNVFVNGTDGALWYTQNTYTANTVPTSWGWQSLGGKLTSAPAATATTAAGINQIGVFVRGSDSVVWYKHYAGGSGWDSWTSVGGLVFPGTSPAAYNWGTAQIGWFVTGSDQSLWHNWRAFSAGGTTAGYQSLGGVLTSSPGATSTGSTQLTGTINVFARGSSGDFATLWQRSYSSSQYGGWDDWTPLTFP